MDAHQRANVSNDELQNFNRRPVTPERSEGGWTQIFADKINREWTRIDTNNRP
jgi:hypothetical protein